MGKDTKIACLLFLYLKTNKKWKELTQMAETFHFNISMISRGKSKSAVASAAYIS